MTMLQGQGCETKGGMGGRTGVPKAFDRNHSLGSTP